jgi:predicted dehydrogenase
MSKINFAVIGTGNIANIMTPVIQSADDCSVVGVFSSSTQRAKEFAAKHDIKKAFDDLSLLLEDKSIEAVYIANTNDLHAATAIAALEAGKAVLCEKPCAISPDEIMAIEKAAANNNQLFMEGLWHLCLPAHQKIRSIRQTLGNPLHLTTSFGYPISESSYPQLFANQSGGVIYDRAIYLLSLALKELGEIEKFVCYVKKNKNGIDTTCQIQALHKSGALSTHCASFDTLLSNEITLSFEKGTVSIKAPSLNGEIVTVSPFKIDMHPRQDSLQEISKESFISSLKNISFLRKIKYFLKNLKFNQISYGKNQYYHQIKHFCDVYKSGKKESEIIPLSLSKQINYWLYQAKKNSEKE